MRTGPLTASRAHTLAPTPRGPQLHTFESELAAGAVALPNAPALRDLVVVAGHAVYTSPNFADASDAEAWHLEAYQRVPGQAESFIAHMRARAPAPPFSFVHAPHVFG
jgi:hypothetical protein